MKRKKTAIPAIIFLGITAILIAYFFPREGKFRYQFYEGKPWRYGLLTAPGDFPVYKADDEVKAEKDSVKQKFAPYFRMDTNVETAQIEKLRAAYPEFINSWSPAAPYVEYIESQLCLLYDAGILPAQQLENLKKEHQTRVYVLTNSMSALKNTADFYSVKSAYDRIVDQLPPALEKDMLSSYRICDYLAENVTGDKDLSAKMLDEQLNGIALSTGMVQAGERIVDRGEVVDRRTYNVLQSLKIHASKSASNRQNEIIWAGQFILIFGIIFCCGLYMASFCPEIFFNRRHVVFILLCILTFCLLSETCVKYNLINIYILPFAIVPIVVRTFFDSHTALFTHLITVLLCSLLAPFSHEFLILQILAGVVVIFSLKELLQRSQLIRCSIFIFVTYALGYLSLSLYQEGDFHKINWSMFLFFGINFILLMFSYALVYIVEKLFGYVSPLTLIELSNINTPTLKKLSETCPGTFQHSMQVSILASEAGAGIGANTQLIRTGALYHDIGKMAHPAFFTENQKSGVNPHHDLTFENSAQIIISHVTEGIKMAEKASLPKVIIDFIRTHHGTGKTKYFYNSFRNAFPDTPVDEKRFTYPGPNPSTKETAVLMMADSVEAASRSLKEYTDETIKTLVDKIIDSQIADGLLTHTPLTFQNINDIKSVFVEKLKTMYHTRISYPELNDSQIQ
ncbi:MAG: HDIG domain-containing protein [Tannerella sp.]|jgi:putative nucleotidyltransferase with HDIG domain|nr:HDIG domain-containing protein [Tannerella sp.]